MYIPPPKDLSTLRFDIHKYKNYWACPKMFLKKYWYEKPTIPKNGYHIVAGEYIQKFFEMYSNKWKSEGMEVSPSSVRARMGDYWKALLRWNDIDWSHPMSRLGPHDLLQECIDTICANVNELDVYDGTKSEIKFVVSLKTGDELVAKMDFIKTTEANKVIILDGKNSGTMGKYVDENQLLFYALIYRFKYGVLPDKIGFLYFRHKVIEYVEITEKRVDDLWKDMIRTMVHIKKAKEFPATPSAKACRFCEYLATCEEGTADMNSRKRGPRKKEDLSKLISSRDEITGIYSIEV